MRLIDILSPPDSPYLLERAIVNIDAMKKVIDGISNSLSRFPEAQAWFKSQLLKYLANRETNPNIIVPVEGGNPQALSDMPPWMRQEAKKGELYSFNLSFDTDFRIHPELGRVIDWVVEWLLLQYAHGKNPLRRGMSWEEAVKKASKEAEVRIRKQETEQMEEKGERTVRIYPGNYYWVMLLNAECVNREGERMSNCLKDIIDDDDDELIAKEYYSLRKNGKPVVTLATEDMAFEGGDEQINVVELSGFANDPPKKEYYDYIIDLIISQGFNPSHSEAAMKILRKGGYVVDERGTITNYKDFREGLSLVMVASSGMEWWTGTEQDRDRVRPVYYLLSGENTLVFKLGPQFDRDSKIIRWTRTYIDSEDGQGYGKDVAELLNKENLKVWEGVYKMMFLWQNGIGEDKVVYY